MKNRIGFVLAISMLLTACASTPNLKPDAIDTPVVESEVSTVAGSDVSTAAQEIPEETVEDNTADIEQEETVADNTADVEQEADPRAVVTVADNAPDWYWLSMNKSVLPTNEFILGLLNSGIRIDYAFQYKGYREYDLSDKSGAGEAKLYILTDSTYDEFMINEGFPAQEITEVDENTDIIRDATGHERTLEHIKNIALLYDDSIQDGTLEEVRKAIDDAGDTIDGTESDEYLFQNFGKAQLYGYDLKKKCQMGGFFVTGYTFSPYTNTIFFNDPDHGDISISINPMGDHEVDTDSYVKEAEAKRATTIESGDNYVYFEDGGMKKLYWWNGYGINAYATGVDNLDIILKTLEETFNS